jgi:hypothetical protein
VAAAAAAVEAEKLRISTLEGEAKKEAEEAAAKIAAEEAAAKKKAEEAEAAAAKKELARKARLARLALIKENKRKQDEAKVRRRGEAKSTQVTTRRGWVGKLWKMWSR